MHTFHKSIGSFLSSLFHNPPTSHVILAPECGGIHRIRFFADQPRCRATNYCWPDIVITKNGLGLIILEIEEAGIPSSGRISSKFSPVAMSDCLFNEQVGRNALPLSREATLIHVLNIASLPHTTQKLLQYKNLESDFRKLLPSGCVARYFLLAIAADQQPPYQTAKYDALMRTIDETLGP